jgi:putative transposase
MPKYLRNYLPGGTYFFTVVTQDRRAILTTASSRKHLRTAIQCELQRAPFTQVAIALLPEHLHTVWSLSEGDADYSIRWKRIKQRFTRSFLADGGEEAETTANRKKHQERGVWQPRFWEHTVRDEDDLERCINYIHYNPVKHGLVERVCDYPWSTFHDYVKSGVYSLDWGCSHSLSDIDGAEWD